MILVDTSVWVNHFRDGNKKLVNLLDQGKVVCHPLIVGELACGNLKNRQQILSLLDALPMTVVATHEEVLQYIENHKLMGKGLGFVDMHLLASALLTDIQLWTLDTKLKKVASLFHLAY